MKYFCLLFLLISSFSSATKVIVGGVEWAGASHADGSGYYFELISKTLPDENIVFQTDSFNRALNSFHTQKTDVMVGVFREETPNAIFPNWYLDIEYPIVGFYNPSLTKFQHTTDLTSLTTSWLRGYQFDRFLTEVKTPYLVNSLDDGFNLLDKNRIQVLVDYQYNLPTQYEKKFSFIELAPARPIYISFQNNDEGRRLAKKFDENIEKLRDSGELEKIFGDEYNHTEFAHFNPNKKKIIILTQDANLLKPLNDKRYFPVVSRLLHGIIEQLTHYNIELKLVPNYAELDKLPTTESYCLSNVFKTPKRQELFNYSQPFALYLGLKLYSLEALDTSMPVDLPLFMQQHQDVTIGIAHGQSYGDDIDAQIAKITEEQKVTVPAKTSMSVKAMLDGEADLIFAYPSVISLLEKEKRPPFEYTLANTDDFSNTYIMCNKNDVSDEFLKDVNTNLSKQNKSKAFFNIQYSSISPEYRAAYTQKFNEVFSTNH